ncbi:uncharacterized protein LOC113147633 [Cyclospora cayetanensis]|uniref:Uncharacterized protein LOC113147633 n=1 Tax=Cyclospora cayetanensis TaxID=88456 RepID=A0A6P6S4B3_9EIME|nr:uncharacterized protein LOC113147633 [Cyclospora cayetanensis]
MKVAASAVILSFVLSSYSFPLQPRNLTPTWHPLLEKDSRGFYRRRSKETSPFTSFLQVGTTLLAPVNDSLCACRIVEEKPEVTEEFELSAAATPPTAVAIKGSTNSFRQVDSPWTPVFFPTYSQFTPVTTPYVSFWC